MSTLTVTCHGKRLVRILLFLLRQSFPAAPADTLHWRRNGFRFALLAYCGI